MLFLEQGTLLTPGVVFTESLGSEGGKDEYKVNIMFFVYVG